MPLTATLLGFVIGASLGLLGGGGSILTVPIFVYVLGFPPKDSVAMSLAVVGLTSIVGSVGHFRRGNVDVRMAALFGGAATLGTWGGTRLASHVSGSTQLAIFGVVMLAASHPDAEMAYVAPKPSGADDEEPGPPAPFEWTE